MTAGLPLMKNILAPLAKNTLMPLGVSPSMSANNAAFQKKTTALLILNEEMKDIM